LREKKAIGGIGSFDWIIVINAEQVLGQRLGEGFSNLIFIGARNDLEEPSCTCIPKL
jgi:hypothetical protein